MIRPWETEIKHYTIFDHRRGLKYECIKEPISDEQTLWKRGDILKFDSCYYDSDDYKDWFLNENDKIKYLKRKVTIPMYAADQYAIMMCRYRVTKIKYYATYKDYGSHIMFISGAKTGKLKKCYQTTPFTRVARFPYVNPSQNIKKIFSDLGITKIPNKLCKLYDNTLKSRTLFNSIIQDKLNEVL